MSSALQHEDGNACVEVFDAPEFPRGRVMRGDTLSPNRQLRAAQTQHGAEAR